MEYFVILSNSFVDTTPYAILQYYEILDEVNITRKPNNHSIVFTKRTSILPQSTDLQAVLILRILHQAANFIKHFTPPGD